MSEFNEETFMNKMKAVVLLGFLFLTLGVVFQTTAFYMEFTQFAPLLDEVAGLPKSVVDEAPVGSDLSQQKIEIAKFPPKLFTLKLVGIGTILAGIFLMLFVITQALRVMPLRLGKVLKK